VEQMKRIPSGDTKKRVQDVWDKLEKEGKGLLWYARRKPDEFYRLFVKAMLPREVSSSAHLTDQSPALFNITIVQGKGQPSAPSADAIDITVQSPTLPGSEKIHNE
jgi:hypothetical protein